MIDRFNIFVGRLVANAQELSLRRQEGQTMAEYALILGLIGIVTVGVLTALGTGIHTKLTSICNSITGGTTCP
jgi:pilus assembly protein Flp/PilA